MAALSLAVAPSVHRGRRASTLRRRSSSSLALLSCCVAGVLGAAASFCAPSAWASAPREAAKRTARLSLRATVDGRDIDGELTPLSSYVLVKPKEAETVSKGGILLPSSGMDKPTEGEVLSVGPGSVDEDTGKKLPMWVEAGSKVLYGKYGAEKIQYNDEEHLLVKDSDVLLMYSGDEPALENIKIPYGKVLIELKEKPQESEGGLILSAGLAKPDTTVGKIVAVSDGVLGLDGEIAPLELKVGDTVRFLFGREVKLELGKSEYRVVDASDCLAKW